MKKKIATLLTLAVILTTTTFAANITDNVSKNVVTAFNQRFAHAEEVHWSKTDTYIKASFKLSGHYLFAYFDAQGGLMGVSRNIVSTQLPINLQTQLMDQYPSEWITELFELGTENDTVYYVTIENADQQITLKSAGTAAWTVFKKVKKD